MIHPNLARSNNVTDSSTLLTLIAVVIVIVGLYFGRQVLIPLALAVVLAFVFTPVVDSLEKCHLNRVVAVLVVLVLAFTLAGSIGWVVTGQLLDIIDRFPSYRSNIHDKIQSFRVPNGGRLNNVTKAVTDLNSELSAASESVVDKKTASPSRSRPIPVQVAEPPANAPQYVRALLGPLTNVFQTSAMVIVFTLFMLVKREDLRNRVIRLMGQDQLTVVTQALDDASRRLKRYLLMQFLVNATYGVLFGSAAYLIGVPHPLLWGVLGALLRFVPYVGTTIVAAFAIGMALAVFPGWHQAALVFSLFIVLELTTANIVEPWLYGAHTGISSLAILVAAVYWAILWGPFGLILSTPLTVCLILMGRYVPQLGFLEVLLGDEAVLPAEVHFYQRLLAMDQEEARDMAEAYLKDKPIESFYGLVLIPALTLSEQDRHLNSLEASIASFVSQSTRELIEELGERSDLRHWGEPAMEAPTLFNNDKSNGVELDRIALSGVRVLCIPAADEADELVAMMAEQLLQRLGCDVRLLPVANRASIIDNVTTNIPQLAIVSALPPFAVGQARALCKSLRSRHPELKIVLGLWGFEGGVAKAKERSGPDCSDMVATSLQQAIALLVEIKPSIMDSGQTQRKGAVR